MSLLSLEHVSKRFAEGRGQTTVLENLSLEVDGGDFIGIWGMRRSGKSTLLRIAAGRELPDEGEVWFDDRQLTDMSPDRRATLQRRNGIGLLSSDWRPERNKPAVEHVALPLLSDGMSLHEARQPAWKALERVGAARWAHMPAGRLSQGERIRVALAQILVHEPRVLLVDEPAILLKPSEGVELYELLRSLTGTSGIAVVIASEDIAPIRKARRLMSLGGGKLRSTDQRGTLLPFPERPSTRRRSQP
jgi:predicted ABC-type transport system involved in lysophospholipase L1 biosynthesis ATPase subunit